MKKTAPNSRKINNFHMMTQRIIFKIKIAKSILELEIENGGSSFVATTSGDVVMVEFTFLDL